MKHLRVRPVVRSLDTRVGEVQPAVLHCQSSPVTQEIMCACTHLDVKLEISIKIGTVNIRA